jgi:hypothetical protein
MAYDQPKGLPPPSVWGAGRLDGQAKIKGNKHLLEIGIG